MQTSLLPIGTIVELQNTESKVIISGYCPQSNARPGYVWDYSGFLFPIGYRSANEIIQFDNNQITKVIAMGYQDEEQFGFIHKLEDAITSYQGNNDQEQREE